MQNFSESDLTQLTPIDSQDITAISQLSETEKQTHSLALDFNKSLEEDTKSLNIELAQHLGSSCIPNALLKDMSLSEDELLSSEGRTGDPDFKPTDQDLIEIESSDQSEHDTNTPSSPTIKISQKYLNRQKEDRENRNNVRNKRKRENVKAQTNAHDILMQKKKGEKPM